MSRNETPAPPLHPRVQAPLAGIDGPAEAFQAARDRDRLHHAWLLTGARGVGKASFAYRAARALLGAEPDPAQGLLGHKAEHPVSRMIAARSHPDLMVLEREAEGVAPRKSIPVDEARQLPEFFAKAPALSRFRVAIIDAADDLNPNAANAVLKTLEEPSARGVLFLISHAPGALLPTIRSRCRRLAFAAWPVEALAAFATGRLDLPHAEARRLAGMAHGAPGRLLSLAAGEALALDDAAHALLSGLPGVDAPAAQRLADGFRGGEGAVRFALLLERLADRIGAGASALAAQGRGEPWARAWSRAEALPAQVEGLNLDRADAFWSLLAELSAVARVQALPC